MCLCINFAGTGLGSTAVSGSAAESVGLSRQIKACKTRAQQPPEGAGESLGMRNSKQAEKNALAQQGLSYEGAL